MHWTELRGSVGAANWTGLWFCSEKEKRGQKINPKICPEEGIQKTVDWMKWYYRLDSKLKHTLEMTM